MILVDTSVWIGILKGNRRVKAAEFENYLTCGPVIQEVFQGLKPVPEAAAFRAAFLQIPRLSDPVPAEVYLEAAEIFRLGRLKGYTIRSSVDCLIAAIAIRGGVPVWHRDRDYTFIARYTPLRAIQSP
jgi:predicted nucleic acid-binding protein